MELFKSITGTVLRKLLFGVGLWLVEHGWVSESDWLMLVGGLIAGTTAVAWGILQKIKAKASLTIALDLPQGSTVQDVKTVAARGGTLGGGLLLIPFLLISTAGLTTGCPSDAQRAIATNVDRVAILVQDGREIRDELFIQTIIDRDEAWKFTLALQKVHNANKTFKAKAETYQASGDLTPDGKQDLTKLANDISNAVTELISNGTFGVKNPDAQARVNAVIGSIRQVVLAIVDSVGQLKTKKPADTAMITSVERVSVDYSGFSPLGLIPLLILALRQVVSFVTFERARTGKTTEEIFAEAGVKIDALDQAFIEDMIKYGPPPENN